jgi:acetylornithine deacetylase/succinyl-diaminopimelate desuccinylase-like protein
MSLGIAAVDVGVFRSAGAHTREEWLEKESMVDGLEILLRMLLALAKD